ncbi:MAG: hypothetical protein DRQ62_01705 [Gammaproteobacteria bacterium]|nr:MAG: hypothetical protein DRQ62_01705 [Gammaproteobacteria bacterium]
MKNIATLMFLLPLGMVSTVQAETTFTEGARDAVTLHPSCRNENTGLTAMGVVLPNGPEIKVTVDNPDGEETTFTMMLPYPDALISKDRKGNVFNGNPIMGARPSFNQAALFGTDFTNATVATFGSKSETEDTKMAFWKLKGVNVYDIESNTLITLPYVPEGELVTVELGFALPKFTPESCLATMNVRGAQVARCDQIDSATKTILVGSEPDIRKKRMRLTVERDLENNPLPAHCGEGISVTLEPTDAEAAELEAKIMTMVP